MGHDTIRLTGLQLEGYHGVFAEEKQNSQPFVVDAELALDLNAAYRSDDLDQTVSYAEVADLIEALVTRESFDLIETLAEVIVRAILLKHPLVQSAAVTVHKPHAPLTQGFSDVSVTIRRNRDHVTRPADGAGTDFSGAEFSTAGAGDSAGEGSEPAQLTGPRPELMGYYQGELVEDPTPTASSATVAEDIGVSVHTGTMSLGAAQARAQLPGWSGAGARFRDPDLNASFPVRCVLALGSNLGDSSATLVSAIRELQDTDGVEVVKISPVARTRPVGGPDGQPDYLNQVIEVETQLSPHALLDVAQQVENDHNRVREERWGPRSLDVDIVTYAGATIDSPRLQVPHPSAAERAFVLMPWSWMDPVAILHGQPVRELAAQAQDADDVHQVSDPEES